MLHFRYEAERGWIAALPISRVLDFAIPPFEEEVWYGCRPEISFTEVQDCINRGDLESAPYEFISVVKSIEDWPRERHCQRVAWLVMNPAEDPIEIEISERGLDLIDGNHRLHAAVFRGDRTVLCCFAGQIDMIYDHFPEAVFDGDVDL